MHFCILNSLLNMWKTLWAFHELTKNERRVVKEISAVQYITYRCICSAIPRLLPLPQQSHSVVGKKRKNSWSNCLKCIEQMNVKTGYSESGKKPLDFTRAWFCKIRLGLIRAIIALRTQKLVSIFHFYTSAAH